MNENEKLREQMWDLCYGLLTADEVAALHKLIKSDPAAARLYAEVRLQADLVASAAKVEDASVTLSVPDEGRKVQPVAKKHSGLGESPFQPKAGRSGRKSRRSPSYRVANWLAGLAATALVALIGYGFYAPSRQVKSSSDDQVVAYVYGNNSLQSGLTQNLKVVAKTPRGEPASTEVSYQVYFANGEMALRDVVQTDQDGEAQLRIPGSAIQPGSRLEVQAHCDGLAEVQKAAPEDRSIAPRTLGENSSRFVVPLAAKEEPVTSDVQLDKDAYQSGETVRFRVHSWRTFSKQPVTAGEDWKLLATDGQEIQPTAIESRPEAGSVSGEFPLPEDAPAGSYTLVGLDPKAGTWQEMDQVVVGLEGISADPNARRSQMASNNRQMRRLHELDLLAGAKGAEKSADRIDAKEHVAAKDKSKLARGGSAPASPAGKALPIPAPAPPSTPAPPPPDAPAAVASSKMAVSPSTTPFAEVPHQRAFSKNGPAAPRSATAAESVEENKESKKRMESFQERLPGQGGQVFDDAMQRRFSGENDFIHVQGDSIAVQIPAKIARKKLLIVVDKDSTRVATQEFDTASLSDFSATDSNSKEYNGEKSPSAPAPAKTPAGQLAERSGGEVDTKSAITSLNLQLPPEADGELDVTLYDQTAEPPRPIYRQQVRRDSRRGLNIDVAAAQQKGVDFAPGQDLQLHIQVTDPNGQEVPRSWLAARVVKLDDHRTLASAPDNFRYAGDKAEKLYSRGSRSGGPDVSNGGFGGGGGKGLPAGNVSTKEGGKGEVEKGDRFNRELLERETKKGEAKLMKATGNPSQPAEPAKPSLAAVAEAGEVTRSSGSGLHPAQDESKEMTAENPAVVSGLGSPLSYADDTEIGELEVPREVLLGSNDSLIQDEVRAEAAAAESARIHFQQLIGQLVLVVAVASLMLLGALAILHRPAQVKVWVPAMAVVAGSFVMGSIWLLNGKFASMEVAKAPGAGQRFSREYVRNDLKPMTPALKLRQEEAQTTLEAVPALGKKSEQAPLGDMMLEKFNEKSSGPRIGPTVELPASGPVPKVEPLPAETAPVPGGVGGGGVSGRKPQDVSPPSAEPSSAADKSGESKDASGKPSRFKRANDAAELKQGVDRRDIPKPAAMKSTEGKPDSDRRVRAPQLLWQPNLPANEQGEAELNLHLPTEPGDYVLIVDVQGPHGIGTVQKHFPVRVPPAAPTAPAAPPKP